jgi:hypothetical protein
LKDICGLVVLTELRIYGKEDPGVELPHNIPALTKLKFLWVHRSKPCQLRCHIGAYNFKNFICAA